MDSDANSDITVFHTISQFENSNLETPDECADLCSTPFRPIHSQAQSESPSTLSHVSQVTPTYSSFTNERSNKKSPDNTQISYEINNLVTLQQQIQHPQTLTIHQFSPTLTSSNPPTLTPSSDNTPSLAQSSTSTQSSSSTNRTYRTFKQKFPSHPFPSKPWIGREYINHTDHTNTTKFLKVTLPFVPQDTYNHSDTDAEQHNYVDEHELIPTLHWTPYYNFSNPLALPLLNTLQDIERNKNDLFRLTAALTPRQFIHVWYKKLLKTFTAPRAKDYSINYYDHNIIRPNQDQFLDDDEFVNPQLNEKFFIRTPYLFTLNALDKKHDHIISETLSDIQAYESFYEQIETFSLTFHFLTPNERDLHCSRDIMLKTKQTHTYTYYQFILNQFDLHTRSRQPHHRIQIN